MQPTHSLFIEHSRDVLLASASGKQREL